MRYSRRVLTVAIAAAAASCALQPPTDLASKIMSYEEVARVEREVPFVRHYKSGSGALTIVGVEHSFDAHGTTTGLIWSEWNETKPTVAFFEGTGWAMGANQTTVGSFGEPAYVRFLAFASRVPVASVEPDLVHEIGHLQKSWSDSEIKVFYTLRWIAERNHSDSGAPSDEEISEFLQSWFPPIGTLSREPSSTQALEQELSTLLPSSASWRQASPDCVEPTLNSSFLNQIARDSGRFRDAYILRTVLKEVADGERVFLAIGFKHVHMLEPALSKALGEPLVAEHGA